MARERDVDNASAASDDQSKHRNSDAHSDVSAAAPHQHRHKQQQKHHVGGRLHSRVPSTKVLHTKPHQHGPAAPKLTRRTTSPGDRESNRRAGNHRRVNSEVKLSRDSSSANLPKSASHSSLRRNRSSIEVAKRNRSSDKLARNPSSTAVNKHKANKSQVTFDIGTDDQDPEDEWVDASGSNSPHMSRKGSLISSGQSSLQRNPVSTENSRPQTPEQSAQPSADASPSEQERVRHKEYLTSRVLKRTMSQGATTQMATQMAQANLPHHSPDSDAPNGSLSTSGNQDGLTSRFVETPGSGIISDGSFYNGPAKQLPTASSRVHSSSSLSQNGSKHFLSEVDNSALVPKAAGRNTAHRAETSRTQQKLNLQRQSSALEPGQAVGVVGGVTGPLIGIGGAGYDGANSRDPRVNRLMERTGMEYLVVRRCQNPIARSLNRLGRLPDLERSKRIPRPGTPVANGKRTAPEAPARHSRNVSMPDPRQTATSRRVATVRSNGAGSSFEGDEGSRLSERISGSSAAEETDDTSTLLRNLWEKSMDFSASTD